MKALYIVYLHPERRSGLFYATHFRIKYSVPSLSNAKIINLCYYDDKIVSILKSAFCLKPTKKGVGNYIYDGLTYENFWIKRGVFQSITPWGKYEKIRINKVLSNESFMSIDRLEYLVKEAKDFDFIMAHWALPNGRIAMRLAEYADKPFFVTYHGSDINTAPFCNRRNLNATLELLRKATLNITVSKALMQKASQMLPEANIFTSPNGIESRIIVKDHINKIEHKKTINIIFIGNLIDDKRADKLPEIISTIAFKSMRSLHFDIVGNGKYYNYIQDELRNREVSCTLHGNILPKEIFKLLHKSAVLILPSRTEGMPLVLLEAIATQTIPVASNVGGISEILEKEFMVDESDSFISDFAVKVVDLIDNPKFPKLNIEDYTWNRIMKNEINEIKTLI